MATNIKAKKKKGTYDNKLIKWIAIGLAAVVAIIVAITIILTVSTNYVAKVDGQKIYTYEYNYFLRQAVSKEYQDNFDEFKPENYDELTSEEQDKVFENFYDAERRAKCQADALEEARKFKAEYKVASTNGGKLTSTERANVKANIDYYISMYVQYYGYTQEQAQYLMTQGSMTLSEYKEFMIKQTAIDKYKNALIQTYNITADEIKAKYDEDPDDYRTLSARVFQFKLTDKPTVPKDNDGKEITAESDSEKYAEYTAALEKYKKEQENFLVLAGNMKTAFDAGETFTLYDYDMETLTPKKDSEDAEKDAVKAENATFEELCTSQSSWTSASSNKGVVSVNHHTSSGVEKIDDFVLGVQWNSSRDGFVVTRTETNDTADETGTASSSSTDDSTVTTGATTATVKPTDIEIIKVTNDDGDITALYLVRVEDITDIDSAADEDSEDGLNTVQQTVKSAIESERADAELEAKVAEGGSKYDLKSLKQKAIDEITNKLLG